MKLRSFLQLLSRKKSSLISLYSSLCMTDGHQCKQSTGLQAGRQCLQRRSYCTTPKMVTRKVCGCLTPKEVFGTGRAKTLFELAISGWKNDQQAKLFSLQKPTPSRIEMLNWQYLVYESTVWNRVIERVDMPSSILTALCDVSASKPPIPLRQHRVYRIRKKISI